MDTVIFSGITVGTVLAYLGGGVGISIVVELIKKVFGLNSSKVIHIVVIAVSVAGVVLADAINTIHGNASVLAGHTAGLLGLAEAAHTFIVSDASAFVGKVQTALNTQSAATPVGNTQTVVTTPVTPEAAPATPTEASF